MSNYSLTPIEHLINIDEEANYIILFGVDNIPPHIGLVFANKYYSKSSQGVKVGYDFEKVLSSVIRKKIPTVLIKLRQFNVDPVKYFDLVSLSPGQSCLNPIKSVLSEVRVELATSRFLFDLIEDLDKIDLIVGYEHVNCDDLIKDNTLLLKKYSQKEIDLAIQEAKRPC